MLPLLLAASLGVPALAQAKITKTSDLRFGTVVLGEGAGTLAMRPDGLPDAQGLFLGSGAIRGPAVFHLEGWPPNQPFTVVTPGRTVVPWRSASFELYQFKPAVRPLGQGLVFDGKGEAHLMLGATLQVAAKTDGTLPEHMMELKVICQETSKTVLFHPEGRIMLPLLAREAESLDFGRMLVPEVATVVALEPATGLRTVTTGNPATLLDNICRAGTFEISGQPGERVSVQLPDPFKPVLLLGPGEPLALSAFTAHPPGELLLSPGGKASVRVGATLTLKGGQSGGIYKGYYTVIFNYP
jgi:hypothetical protein